MESEEIFYDGAAMITETDANGRIVYVNRKFIEMSGYGRDELIGRAHSIVRHPDMPHACFKHMWETLREGQVWQGYVKNLCKDGKFYWVVVHVTPKFEENHLSGFIAVRKKPDRNVLERVQACYKEALRLEAEGLKEEAIEQVEGLCCKDARGMPGERVETVNPHLFH